MAVVVSLCLYRLVSLVNIARSTNETILKKNVHISFCPSSFPVSCLVSCLFSLVYSTASIQFNSIQFICIAQFHKLQICLGVLYNLYT